MDLDLKLYFSAQALRLGPCLHCGRHSRWLPRRRTRSQSNETSAPEIRIGGWLAGNGLVLSACVAGDWISLSGTLKDFVRCSWPLAIFACLYAFFERTLLQRVLVKQS